MALPESLRDFVTRCFMQYPDRKEEIGAVIKQIIQTRFDHNTVNTTDWHSMAIPQLPLLQQAAAFSPMYIQTPSPAATTHPDYSQSPHQQQPAAWQSVPAVSHDSSYSYQAYGGQQQHHSGSYSQDHFGQSQASMEHQGYSDPQAYSQQSSYHSLTPSQQQQQQQVSSNSYYSSSSSDAQERYGSSHPSSSSPFSSSSSSLSSPSSTPLTAATAPAAPLESSFFVHPLRRELQLKQQQAQLSTSVTSSSSSSSSSFHSFSSQQASSPAAFHSPYQSQPSYQLQSYGASSFESEPVELQQQAHAQPNGSSSASSTASGFIHPSRAGRVAAPPPPSSFPSHSFYSSSSSPSPSSSSSASSSSQQASFTTFSSLYPASYSTSSSKTDTTGRSGSSSSSSSSDSQPSRKGQQQQQKKRGGGGGGAQQKAAGGQPKERDTNKRRTPAKDKSPSSSHESDDYAYFSAQTSSEEKRRRLLKYGAEDSKKIVRTTTTGQLDPDADVVGTSEALEKPYLRLTDEVDPSTVRPLGVLKQALEHVLNRWDREKDYLYICEQLKSIRQDLVVQRIFDSFAVRVYETHARIALRNDDIAEFAQCQSQLRPLYEDHHLGDADTVNEFMAYRLLFHLKTNTMVDLNMELSMLTAAQRRIPVVVHAIQTCLAWSALNYAAFFRLYRQAPNLGTILMDTFVPRFRQQALLAMGSAYRELEIDLLQEALALDTREELLGFAGKLGYVVDASGTKLAQAP